MVQLMKSGDFGPETLAIPCTEKVPVKLEVEESLEEEHGPLNKRSKPSPAFQEVRFCILFLIRLLIFSLLIICFFPSAFSLWNLDRLNFYPFLF